MWPFKPKLRPIYKGEVTVKDVTPLKDVDIQSALTKYGNQHLDRKALTNYLYGAYYLMLNGHLEHGSVGITDSELALLDPEFTWKKIYESGEEIKCCGVHLHRKED